MNRKIKVRVWLKLLGRFATKDEWFIDFDGDLHFWDIVENDLIRIPDSNYVVQQFTGLLDKNRKEIFEGDIIKHQFGEPNVSVVEWISEDNQRDYSGWCIESLTAQGGEREIIGNVFENSELLKQ